jgi:inosose dehydratase
MTSSKTARAFGVDLITFFDDGFWGFPSEELPRRIADDPRALWERMLDGLQAAGVTEFEMTFPPADQRTAVAAYGSPSAFRAELDRRGLRVVSSYFGDIEKAVDVTDDVERAGILAAASTAATFLAELGAEYLVAGLPMRRTDPSGSGLVAVGLAQAQPIADLLNEVGAVTKRVGVTLALHPESHSVFWTPRDIDLFLLLTDPFRVAFCPDTGHIVLGGGDPVEVVRRHADRVVLAHWKDATGPFREDVPVDGDVFVRHRPYFRPAGKGVIDWHAWVRLLSAIGYQGGVLLELDAAPDPVAQLTEAREFLENVTRDHL